MESSTFPIAKYSWADAVMNGRPQWQHKYDDHMYLIVDSSPPGLATAQRARVHKSLKVMHNATCLDSVNIEELSGNTQLAIRDAKARGIDLVTSQYPVSATIKYPLVALKYNRGDIQAPRRIQVKLTSDKDYDFVIAFLKEVQCPISHVTDSQRPVSAVGTTNISYAPASTPNLSDPFDARFSNQVPYPYRYNQYSESQSQSQNLQPAPQYVLGQNFQMPVHQRSQVWEHQSFQPHTSYISRPHSEFNVRDERFQQYPTVASLDQSLGPPNFQNIQESNKSPEVQMIQPTNFKRPASRPLTASQILETVAPQRTFSADPSISSRPGSENARPGTAGRPDTTSGAKRLPTPQSRGNDVAVDVEEVKRVKKAPAKAPKGRKPLSTKDKNTSSPPGIRPPSATTKDKAAGIRDQAAACANLTKDGNRSENICPIMPQRSTSAMPIGDIENNLKLTSAANRHELAENIMRQSIGTAEGQQQLLSYGTQTVEDRQRALKELMLETLNNPSFQTLCEDIQGAFGPALSSP